MTEPSPPATTASPVMDALVHLEEAKLAKWCHSVRVDGVIAQTVTLKLREGQGMWSSKGALLAYDDTIAWQLKVPGGAGKAVRRMMSGESASLAWVTARQDGAEVVLAANQAGRLVTWDLANGDITCTAGSFVGAVGDVDIDVTVARSAGAAFFGGAGLFMQKLSGTGVVILHGAGDFVERTLAPGERLLVSTGNLAFFSSQVAYGIRGVGGCLKMMFGGEGLFMTEMTGPGWVMLQSLKKLPVPTKSKRSR